MNGNRRHHLYRLAAIVLMLTLIAPLGIQQAFAAPVIINEIKLTCNPASAGFDPANTERQVGENICKSIESQTAGVTVNKIYPNTSLSYLKESSGTIWGVGSGTGKVNSDRKYYLFTTVELESGYDWTDEIKTLETAKEYPITDVPSVTVYLNGEKQTGALIKNYSANIKLIIPFGPEMASCKATTSGDTFTYDGSAKAPSLQSLTLYDKAVPETCYAVSYADANNQSVSSPINAGKYAMVLEGKGMYLGSFRIPFSIQKAANTMTAKGKTVTIKASKVAKKKQTIKTKKAYVINNAIGDVTFTKVSGNKKITVAPDGKITVKKGLKRGKYKVKINVIAGGDSNHEPATVTVTVTVKVK